MTGETLREGIFSLNTRRFGTVAELLVARLARLGKGRSLFHDLYDDVRSQRAEVKFSRVLKKHERRVTEQTVLQCIAEATSEQRMVAFSDWRSTHFDCNIQQIKRAEFEVLYYGLFFADEVPVFRIESQAIGSQILYSNKQHKGNVGEGQFHISEKTLQLHLDNYLYRSLSYGELLELLS